MGESFTSPALNVANHVLPQPTPPSLVVEDDDEPPSSGSNHRSSEMKFTSDGPTNPLYNTSTSLNEVSEPVVSAHGTPVHIVDEKHGAKASFKPEVAASGRLRAPALSKGARLLTLFTPVKPLGPRPTYKASALASIKYTPLNICLLFIPVSWALHFTHQSATLIFVFSALGIIPLAALLGLGTEQIALRTSQSVGGLLNATLGNIVEMIIAGIALKRVSDI